MARKSKARTDHSRSGETATTNPFAALADLKGSLPDGSGIDAKPETAAEVAPFADKVVVARERKGRAGKTVTVIRGVRLSGEALENFVRQLRKSLGTSGQVEGDQIVLGGDIGERTAKLLEARGARRVIMANY